jgi:hypothetical protein
MISETELEALFENDETIRSKYTLDELKGGQEWVKAFDAQRRYRRQEDRRRLAVRIVGYIFGFVGFYGLPFILFCKLDIVTLLADRWGFGSTLSVFIVFFLCIGLFYFLWEIFFWVSDKTGLHYFMEDWVGFCNPWYPQECDKIRKYKTFPRRERRVLIKELKKELYVFGFFSKMFDEMKRLEKSPDFKEKLEKNPNLKKAYEKFNAVFYPFGKESCESDDEKIWDNYDDEELPSSVEGSIVRINRVIADLVREVDISSRRLTAQPEHASWIGFVLTLEKTSAALELELKDPDKYHKTIQPFLTMAFDVTSKAMNRINDSCNDKRETDTV